MELSIPRSLSLPFICVVALTPLWNAGPAWPSPSFQEVGNFYLQNFAPEDTGGSPQNWAIAQDHRGFIYVGNNSGILEFDGVTWQPIEISNRSRAISLAADPAGRIYVGADHEIGYLAPDALGRTRFVSLMEHLPPEDRDFADVWQTRVLSDGVYFQTSQSIFRWHNGTMDVWHSEVPLARSFVVRDTFYAVSAQDPALFFLLDDGLRPIEAQELSDAKPVEILPKGTHGFLAVTLRRGLLHCLPTDGQAASHGTIVCSPFGQEVKDLLIELKPYCAIELDNGLLAIGTRLGGLVLVDSEGGLVRVLNTDSGLRSNQVWFAKPDHQGGLWLALNEGLARVEVTHELSYFDASNGLVGTPIRAARHQGRFFVATSQGLFVLRQQASAMPRFEPAVELSNFCWSLISTEQGLLAGCDGGVYNVDRRRWAWQDFDATVFALHRSRNDPTRVFVGLEDGLAQLELGAEGWNLSGRFSGIPQVIRSLVEDAQGQLWMGTSAQGVLRMSADASVDGAEVRVFDEEHGLPSDWLEPFIVAGQVRVWTGEGKLLSWSDGVQRFEPDTVLAPGEDPTIQSLMEDDAGRVWIAGPNSAMAQPSGDGSYALTPIPWRRDERIDAIAVLAEPEGAVWAITMQHLIRLVPELSEDASQPLRSWIRSTETLEGTVLFEGSKDLRDQAPVWPYSQGSLRFTFAAPQLAAPERTKYRVRLEGLDEGWSKWTEETRKDYTKLWEGRYTFRVQAQDIYGDISAEDTFTFRIAPPWFRSGWAYGLYILLFALAIFAWSRRHRKELQRERQAADRERAINAKLREVDKLKDAFLANTSHELRTPLYGMTGLAESLIDGAAGDLPSQAKEHLTLLVQSGRRLSVLVDDLLDVSKLDQQSLELNLEPVDLHSLTDIVLTLSMPLAREKGLDLVNRVASDLPRAQGDLHRIQQILHNLVGNAIKYTDAGQVDVSARLDGDRIEISVHDTGVGIADDNLEKIFEPFVQVDASLVRRQGGTGLGLAVSRQLVELHGGTLKVESEPGQGSTFSFTVPKAGAVQPDSDAASTPRVTTPQALYLPDSLPDLSTKLSTSTSLDGLASKRKILVVDDEPIVRQVLENHLAAAGYQVTVAASGTQAVSKLEDSPPDLILLDIMMPKMSGYEVCRVIRQHHSVESLPILFLSAMSRTEDRTAALEQGGNDYLSKPIAKPELLARVALHLAVLEAHRIQQQEIATLQDMLPICMCCKKIRDDEGLWNQLEAYMQEHLGTTFTHGICPSCAAEMLHGLGN